MVGMHSTDLATPPAWYLIAICKTNRGRLAPPPFKIMHWNWQKLGPAAVIPQGCWAVSPRVQDPRVGRSLKVKPDTTEHLLL